ncbi:Phosphatidylinositol glycan anchor biosynthesis class U protein [Phytophthora nicotianae]|uniref:Phosphatidylinositol glycan anchor biosynthesis class U protein n=1 Tax=Phytophthora nicotianae TaxID=4792 RepID=A0A0W8C6L1_PHYNI|nr:Phosphatidylinositol glycan anchor biosynthesis class U protein [Phytophthora nicotianae]
MPRVGLPAVLLLGACVRAFLYVVPSIHVTLSTRPELSTSISSFHRLQEGVFLFQTTGSPYSGDVYHQPPLLFALLYPVLQVAPASLQYFIICTVCILVDLLLAMGFARLCKRNLKLEEGRRFTFQDKEVWLTLVPVSPLFKPKNLPTTVAFIALMNPYSLASSVAMSSVGFTHLAVLYSLVFASEGALAASMMCVAVGTYLSVYPFFLMIPIVLLLRSVKDSSLVSLVETYVWVAKYSDLTPNIGIFWYFFMEVFDRFIPYFLFVLHLHPVIYIVPIYLRLAHRPQAYACALIGIFSLFQAYPSFGDFGFFLSMLAMHPKTIMTIENRFVYVLGLGVATCMLPVMWFLWLFPASGNANFFYNQTLVYQIFNTQIITAFVGATMKRDKDVDKYRASRLKQLEKTSE